MLNNGSGSEDYFKSLLKPLALEAKATGDYDFFNQVTDHYARLTKTA